MNEEMGFANLHGLEKWDRISTVLWRLQKQGETLTRQAEEAGTLASEAAHLLFLTQDREKGIAFVQSIGETEEYYHKRIAELEEGTKDPVYWSNSFAAVLATCQKLTAMIQALEDATDDHS